MLEDPLVEALEAGREKRQRVLACELVDEPLVQLATLRGEGDHPPVALYAVHGLEGRVDDVDAQHHARTAAVGLVVDLPARERREVAVVEELELQLGAEHRGERPLLGEP